MITALAFLVVSATPLEGDGPPVFTRSEPHLEDGAELLSSGSYDAAIEEFRNADADNADERAIVEYNIGSALLARATQAPPAAQQPQQPQQPAPSSQPSAAPDAQPSAPNASEIDDARAAFERAFALANNRVLKSEAALANGNAAAAGGKIDDAIAEYRKAIVADPQNERAKLNLRRALEAKKQQPPQQNNESGGGKDNEDKERDEQKKEDQEQQDEQESGSDDKKQNPNEDDKKQQQEQQSGDDKQKDDEKKKKEQEKPQPGDEKGDQKKQQEQEQPKPGDKKAQKREEARRLLEALKAREKPLTPMEMRGIKKQPATKGKDW